MAAGEDETQASYDRSARQYAELQWGTRLVRQMGLFEAAMSGGHVLDLGCGPGRDVEWLGERGHDAVGIDLSVGQLAEARRRVPAGRFVRGDISSLPFPDDSFDGVWSCSVLVHLDRDDCARALGEVARVLRPGAALYLGVEQGTDAEWRIDAGGRRRYFFWQPDELAAALEGAGLGVTDQYVEHVDRFHFLTTHARRRTQVPDRPPPN